MTDQELRQALRILLDLWEDHGKAAVNDLLLSLEDKDAETVLNTLLVDNGTWDRVMDCNS